MEHYLRRISQLDYRVIPQDDSDVVIAPSETGNSNLELTYLHSESMTPAKW